MKERPQALSGAPLATTIRACPEDFRVEEIAAYTPDGRGDHLYVFFEKRELDTPEAVRRIARACGVHPRDAGYAGLKDRNAVTRQWASFLFGDEQALRRQQLEGIRVLSVTRHGNKLRTGHLKGNRFTLRLRPAGGRAIDERWAGELRRRLDQLVARGVPNYFGDQRFGREGSNVERANAWLIAGGKAPRSAFERKLLVSALQSAVFNELLAERVVEQTFDRILAGDVCRKETSGGMFVVRDEAELADVAERAASFEISPTGPMVGAKMVQASAAIARRERHGFARWGLSEACIARFLKYGAGSRRAYRAPIRDAEVSVAQPDGLGEALELVCCLPKGTYATILVEALTLTPPRPPSRTGAFIGASTSGERDRRPPTGEVAREEEQAYSERHWRENASKPGDSTR